MNLRQFTNRFLTFGLVPVALCGVLTIGGLPVSAAVVTGGHNAQPQAAPSSPDASAALLDRIRSSAEQVLANLTNFACSEQIDRYRGSARKQAPRKVDVVTTRVSYSSASEHYSDIYEDQKPLSQIGALSGAWSAGEYGTILAQTAKALHTRPVHFLAFSPLDGKTAAVYRFDYTADCTPWDINVSGVKYALPFYEQVWASPTTGDILRIDRIAYNVPQQTGIAAVTWAVMFGPNQADGKSYWLPAHGVYSVSYLNADRHEWNEIAFSGYKRFGVESAIRFQ